MPSSPAKIELSERDIAKVRAIAWRTHTADEVIEALTYWNAGYGSGKPAEMLGVKPQAFSTMLANLTKAGVVGLRKAHKKPKTGRTRPQTVVTLLQDEIAFLKKHADMDPAARMSLNRARRWLKWHQERQAA